MEKKPFKIIFIALYCFFCAVFCLFWAANGLLETKGVFTGLPLESWISIVLSLLVTITCFSVGVGILFLNRFSWRFLFFLLIICVSFFFSIAVSGLILLFFSSAMGLDVLQSISNTSNIFLANFFSYLTNIFSVDFVKWLPVLLFVVSQIFVFYYLIDEDVRRHFNED